MAATQRRGASSAHRGRAGAARANCGRRCPGLALEIARRLLAGFEPPPEVIERLWREALEQLYPERENLELSFARAMPSCWSSSIPTWRQRYPGLRVRGDASARAGDCLVRSRFGLTDARQPDQTWTRARARPDRPGLTRHDVCRRSACRHAAQPGAAPAAPCSGSGASPASPAWSSSRKARTSAWATSASCARRGPISRCRAEVVGFREHRVLLMPLGDTAGLHVGCEVAAGERPPLPRRRSRAARPRARRPGPPVRRARLPAGRPRRRSAGAAPPHPLRRQRIQEPLATGVRAIDTFMPLGRGQRLGLFAGSGVGKSTLLGMMARGCGRRRGRGRPGGRTRPRGARIHREGSRARRACARSVVVVATSDTPAPLRLRAAFTATAIAEAYRDEGKNVLLLMDSVTRFAMAQREIGLAVGEPPTTRGYTPSVFALAAPAARARRRRRDRRRSPPSTPCWSKATISTSR